MFCTVGRIVWETGFARVTFGFPKSLEKLRFEVEIMYSGSPFANGDWAVHVIIEEGRVVVSIESLINILSNGIGRRGIIDFA